MSRRRTAFAGLLALASAVALALAGIAGAGTPGKWTSVTRTNAVGASTEPGIARTSDGVLHVVWHHPTSATAAAYTHTPISPSGAVGAPSTVQAAWASLNTSPSLVPTPTGGLALFFTGAHTASPGDPLNSGQLYATFGDAAGRSWSAPQLASSSRAGPGAIAAAVIAGGTFVQTVGDPFNFFHFGLGGVGIPYETRGCCVYDPGLGVDSQTGTVVLGWFSNLTSRLGLYTRTITPAGAVGQPAFVPGSATANRATANQPLQRTPLTGRIGAPGVYLAYGAGYPSYRSVNLLRIGGGRIAVARGRDFANVNVASAPEGRLWVMWTRAGAEFATRSNRAATRFEPVTRIKPPRGAVDTYGLWGDGARGRLDLLANTASTTRGGIWHTQVLPRLSATARSVQLRSGSSRVTVTVTDAGDAVPGATVKAGSIRATTDAAGKATFLVRRHARARVSKSGYRGTTARL